MYLLLFGVFVKNIKNIDKLFNINTIYNIYNIPLLIIYHYRMKHFFDSL